MIRILMILHLSYLIFLSLKNCDSLIQFHKSTLIVPFANVGYQGSLTNRHPLNKNILYVLHQTICTSEKSLSYKLSIKILVLIDLFSNF